MKKTVKNIESKAILTLRDMFFEYKETMEECGVGSHIYARYQAAMDLYLISFGYSAKRQDDLEAKWNAMFRKLNGTLY